MSAQGFGQLVPAETYGPGLVWMHRIALCPSCKNPTIDIFARNLKANENKEYIRIYPSQAANKPVHESVPPQLKNDYLEAWGVLSVSPRASAALSRRCLQHMLRENGYQAKDLAQEIELLLNETNPLKILNYSTRQSIDAIRNFGNFAAHPIREKASLDIIDVESEEAEWCLETIRALFDHFYTAPWTVNKRKADLNAKLTKAGKPLAKG